jgi:hypothetical protein
VVRQAAPVLTLRPQLFWPEAGSWSARRPPEVEAWRADTPGRRLFSWFTRPRHPPYPLAWMGLSNCQGNRAASQTQFSGVNFPGPHDAGISYHPMPWIAASNCQHCLAASPNHLPGVNAAGPSPRRHAPRPNALDELIKLPGLAGGVPWPGTHDAGIPHHPMAWMGPSNCHGYLAASRDLVLPTPASPTHALDGPVKLPGLPGGVH